MGGLEEAASTQFALDIWDFFSFLFSPHCDVATLRRFWFTKFRHNKSVCPKASEKRGTGGDRTDTLPKPDRQKGCQHWHL
jgi:hypothetical protein